MVKLDTQNSRMKDFHDLWALSGAFEFNGATLQRAVAACFDRRRTPWTDETPRALTPAQFADIGERITDFLGPVRDSIVADEPHALTWPAGGPWQPRKESSP